MSTDILRYPVGPFEWPASLNEIEKSACIAVLEGFPAAMRRAVEGLSDAQLDTPYRPDGWTLRQVVHHCADSHANCLIRFKLALTEEVPVIKPYLEARWAELADSRLPVEPALTMLEGIHQRLVALLRSLSADQWAARFIHPEKGREISLKENLALYSWHCRHHLAHITTLRSRRGW